MSQLQECLGDLARQGWGVSGLGMLRENAFGGKPRRCFCAIYPAFFGKEVWWDRDKENSWSIITPRYVGYGVGHVAAIQDAIRLAENAVCKAEYAKLTDAMQRNVDARNIATERCPRVDRGEPYRNEGDGDWMDSSEADLSGD